MNMYAPYPEKARRKEEMANVSLWASQKANRELQQALSCSEH
jgi:hypothetical protein